eukprot:1292901-Prymnesium_polylepis.2
MEAMNAKTHEDIIFGDHSLFLGHPATRSEMKKGEYGAPSKTSDGATKAVKLGMETIDKALAEAKETKSTLPLELPSVAVAECIRIQLASIGHGQARVRQGARRGEAKARARGRERTGEGERGAVARR